MTPEEKALLDIAVANMNKLLGLAEQTLGVIAPLNSYKSDVLDTDSELAAGLKIIIAKQKEEMMTYEQYYAKKHQDSVVNTQEENSAQKLGPIL